MLRTSHIFISRQRLFEREIRIITILHIVGRGSDKNTIQLLFRLPLLFVCLVLEVFGYSCWKYLRLIAWVSRGGMSRWYLSVCVRWYCDMLFRLTVSSFSVEFLYTFLFVYDGTVICSSGWPSLVSAWNSYKFLFHDYFVSVSPHMWEPRFFG